MLELAEHGVDDAAILFQVLPAGVGDLIKLLGAVGFECGVSDLFEIRHSRVDHARTRSVKAARAFLEVLDQFVAVAWFLLQQGEDDEMQVCCGKFAAGAKAPAAAKGAGETCREVPKAMPAMVAPHREVLGAKVV